jgi:hypothetical protein
MKDELLSLVMFALAALRFVSFLVMVKPMPLASRNHRVCSAMRQLKMNVRQHRQSATLFRMGVSPTITVTDFRPIETILATGRCWRKPAGRGYQRRLSSCRMRPRHPVAYRSFDQGCGEMRPAMRISSGWQVESTGVVSEMPMDPIGISWLIRQPCTS